ncbi:suppressor of cytokine signaling 3b [Brienomyrus brachyistius]|uniref:suppressor of cytokine signaling 3b n=1 Tax=Brienomyrus brachyistius TaxID=42636 RepID=UPI0020B44550|nr:suppressor of cytokine signaling 3b [Brienomyrus brachyistius]
MVTYSKLEPVMSSSPFDTGAQLQEDRYKMFGSQPEYQLVLKVMHKLQESGFYWGAVSGKEANGLLSAEPAGTFLVRDSSDNRHFFTLSVKTTSGTKNLRIQFDGTSFFLQTDPMAPSPVPSFDCVLKLVHHYMSSEAGPHSTFFIQTGMEKIPLELLRPLTTSMSSLQHLCRKTVNGHLDVSSKREQLPQGLKNFLEDYDAPI